MAAPAAAGPAAAPPLPPPAVLMDALRAVLEALDIPVPAETGDQVHVLVQRHRITHAVVMLRAVAGEDALPLPDVAWHAAYLRAMLAGTPAAGYRTWHERVAEIRKRAAGAPS